MKDLLLTLLHLAVMAAKLSGPGGVRAVIAENLLLTQQLIVLHRTRQRAPNLMQSDRLLWGFGSLCVSNWEFLSSHQTLEEAERAHIVATLKETGWILSGPRGAAMRLGINRSTLQFREKAWH